METQLSSLSGLTAFTLGLVLGFKHATEVDHVVAVSAIVSQHRSVWRSAVVGLMWGVGHTASLLVIGMLVLVFKVTIPASVSDWFELLVAVMIVVLGALGLLTVLRKRTDVHYHRHDHLGRSHAHVHFHEAIGDLAPKPYHSHAISRIGLKPILVGSIHGLAGSAALTLLILPHLKSVMLGLSYLLTFGLGSVGGMLLMSMIMSVPFVLAGRTLTRTHDVLQLIAAGGSVLFGLWYAYLWTIG